MAIKKKVVKKKGIKKKARKTPIKKQKVTEVFEVTKGKKEKLVTKKGIEEVPISTKDQSEHQNKLLRNILIIIGIIFAIIIGLYFYTQSMIFFNYEGIEFEAKQIGDLLFYETITLDVAHDGNPFGFRLRTKPSTLKGIDFENIDDFELTKINGYSYEGEFDCEGDGVIAMANLQRLFERMGMGLIRDEESDCDPEGRYNYFTLKYGDDTEIKEVGNRCYEIIIEGNNDQCEILPATEKLMVELFVKYRALE